MTHQLPDELRNKTKTLIKQNKNWQYQLYNDNQIQEILKTHLQPDFFQFQSKLPLRSMKTDLWKYSLLYLKGGMHIDVGTEPIKPIKNWHIDIEKDDSQVIFVLDYVDQKSKLEMQKKNIFYFWAVLAIPGHPIFKSIIAAIQEEFQKIDKDNTYNFDNNAHILTGLCAVTKGISEFFNLEFDENYEYANDPKNIFITVQNPKSKAYQIAKQYKIKFITRDSLISGQEQKKKIPFSHIAYSNFNYSLYQQSFQNESSLNTEQENDHLKYKNWLLYFQSLEIQKQNQSVIIDAQNELTSQKTTGLDQQQLSQQNNSLQPSSNDSSTQIKIQNNETTSNNPNNEGKVEKKDDIVFPVKTNQINSTVNQSVLKEIQVENDQSYEISNMQLNTTSNTLNSDQISNEDEIQAESEKTNFLSTNAKLIDQKKNIMVLKQIFLSIILVFISVLIFFFIKYKIQQYKEYQQQNQEDQNQVENSRQVQNQTPQFGISSMADNFEQINIDIDKL